MVADSMPDGWLTNYLEQGHDRHSPLRSVNGGDADFKWRMSDWDGRLDERQRRWRDDNLSAGITHGYNIYDRAGGERKIIALCGTDAKELPHAHDLMTLQFAAYEMFARMHALGLPREAPNAGSLTAREAECLTWAAAGKSDWEIGEILTLSGKTVNHHIERAKAKLQAATRVQAVVIAMRRKLIRV